MKYYRGNGKNWNIEQQKNATSIDSFPVAIGKCINLFELIEKLMFQSNAEIWGKFSLH